MRTKTVASQVNPNQALRFAHSARTTHLDAFGSTHRLAFPALINSVSSSVILFEPSTSKAVSKQYLSASQLPIFIKEWLPYIKTAKTYTLIPQKLNGLDDLRSPSALLSLMKKYPLALAELLFHPEWSSDCLRFKPTLTEDQIRISLNSAGVPHNTLIYFLNFWQDLEPDSTIYCMLARTDGAGKLHFTDTTGLTKLIAKTNKKHLPVRLELTSFHARLFASESGALVGGSMFHLPSATFFSRLTSRMLGEPTRKLIRWLGHSIPANSYKLYSTLGLHDVPSVSCGLAFCETRRIRLIAPSTPDKPRLLELPQSSDLELELKPVKIQPMLFKLNGFISGPLVSGLRIFVKTTAGRECTLLFMRFKRRFIFANNLEDAQYTYYPGLKMEIKDWLLHQTVPRQASYDDSTGPLEITSKSFPFRINPADGIIELYSKDSSLESDKPIRAVIPSALLSILSSYEAAVSLCLINTGTKTDRHYLPAIKITIVALQKELILYYHYNEKGEFSLYKPCKEAIKNTLEVNPDHEAIRALESWVLSARQQNEDPPANTIPVRCLQKVLCLVGTRKWAWNLQLPKKLWGKLGQESSVVGKWLETPDGQYPGLVFHVTHKNKPTTLSYYYDGSKFRIIGNWIRTNEFSHHEADVREVHTWLTSPLTTTKPPLSKQIPLKAGELCLFPGSDTTLDWKLSLPQSLHRKLQPTAKMMAIIIETPKGRFPGILIEAKINKNPVLIRYYHDGSRFRLVRGDAEL